VPGVEPYAERIEPLRPFAAYELFMSRFRELDALRTAA
jgi:hypothetical protein